MNNVSVVVLLFILISIGNAKISMPSWFGSNMVLQSNAEYGARSFLNGKSSPSEKILVSVKSASKNTTYEIQANEEGVWKLQILVPTTSSDASTISITVTGEDPDDSVVAENVTAGDVFFCSGQSNMVFPMKLTLNATSEMATLRNYPHFRFFMTNRGTSDVPEFDVPDFNASTCDTKVPSACNRWVTAKEAIESGFIEDFSAVCYMTVRDVARIHIGNEKPVALVQSAWGGTRVEAWMSEEAIQTASRRVLPTSSSSPVVPPQSHNAANVKSALYNAMIAPFDSMSVRAALWYQGEANADQKIDPVDVSRGVTQTAYYAAYLSTMIEDWRERNGMGDFSFFVVSLPPSVAAGTPMNVQLKTGRSEVRIAEFSVAPRPNGTTCISGVPVCTELGGSSAWGFDHPYDKNEISRRLALQVVHASYGVQGRMSFNDSSYSSTLWTGPQFSDIVTVDKSTMRVRFLNWTAIGLQLKDVRGLVNHDGTRNDCTLCCDNFGPFEVLNADGNWIRVPRNNTVVVQSTSSVDLKELSGSPRALRYGWSDFQECIVTNNDSLPLAPFVWTNDKNSRDSRSDEATVTSKEVAENSSFRPPLGFNTWNFFHCNIDENEVKAIAEIMIDTGLAAAGYEYINIDDCWQVDRLANGTIVVDPVRFPSGMKALADFVHSKGLKFGVYTAQHALTCQDRPGSFDHEFIDAETYCEWGIDYLKVDGCHGESHPHLNTSWIRFRHGFDTCFNQTGRYTTLSVESCLDPNECGEWIGQTADLWRTTGDVQAYWASVLSNIHRNDGMASVVNDGQGKRNGHGNFNDPDMLEIGNSGLSIIEQRSMFSLWAIAGAPLLIGTSVTDMSNETLEILTNGDILRVNQDLGFEGKKIQGTVVEGNATTGWEIWAKPLEDEHTVAIALLNLDDNTNATITARFSSWGWNDTTTANARDLWSGKNRSGSVKGSLTVENVRPHEASMFLLTMV